MYSRAWPPGLGFVLPGEHQRASKGEAAILEPLWLQSYLVGPHQVVKGIGLWPGTVMLKFEVV